MRRRADRRGHRGATGDERPRIAGAAQFFPAEFLALCAVDPDQRLEAFLRCWTRKEACLKALGSGLSIEPGVFEAGIETEPRFTAIDVQGQACAMAVHSLALPFPGQAACARLADTDRHLAM